MIRGPTPNSRPAGATFADKAAAAWQPVPDWIAVLAAHADHAGLKGTAERINYSVSAVSTVISGKYAGDVGRVEAMVRGALMAETVDCPVLGAIGRDRCLREQKEPFRATSAFRVRMYHACRRCPIASQNQPTEGKDP